MTMEFKSQICTTKEQSDRLLKLGLKKETADCHWFYHDEHWEIKIGFDLMSCENLYPKYYIPAWSLHRLMEILSYTPELSDFAVELQYDAMIIHIANAIEANNINKDYLEEKKWQ